MAKIELSNIRKEYSVKGGVEVAVGGIDLEIESGEFISIVGPSGCGKTTTLRCIAGLEIPTEGTIEFDGVDITEVPANKRDLAMMFQDIALYPHMTVRQNIAYPLKIDGVDKSARHETAREAAEVMQIEELLDKYPGELSGGQQQRTGLARTIVQDPIAFLMDEPLSDLDAQLKIEMRREIQRVHRRLGKATIYVTHDQEEALTMSDRVVVLNDGRIKQVGTTDEVYNRPANTFVATFIGNPSINYLEGIIDTVDDDTAVVTFHGTQFEVQFEPDTASSPGDSVTVGIRPQHVEVVSDPDEGHLSGELSLFEPVDDRAHTTVDGPEGEFRAVTRANAPLDEGEQVGLFVDDENVLVFDDDTGTLLARSIGTKQPVSGRR
ncbi:ABC-type spermidine/putrescine transport system,ATPase component [Halalkaliarchaeum sp. AArc-CO]|uniref:ABC transporter ATP-binding protein n=1 Tax=Halalkaliarchaeum sp. AArc-CO TaxID=2866381 RepID=UPI00217E0FAD|nr:ABC transporter ATP-binding protein [Halalkaliarchaeum sp. AArc-CO]UWG51931.1 ABC-type spermidine/putrescine transport system,ATPase component [Halalkaliarchaeum sp. AArc-CO]